MSKFHAGQTVYLVPRDMDDPETLIVQRKVERPLGRSVCLTDEQEVVSVRDLFASRDEALTEAHIRLLKRQVAARAELRKVAGLLAHIRTTGEW